MLAKMLLLVVMVMVVVMTVLERGKGIEFHHGGRGGWCGGIALALGGAALLLVSLGRDPVRPVSYTHLTLPTKA